VLILCGGRGTRLQRGARPIPKPMVEIGGRPILWHVIQIYLAQGFDRFLLLTGYLGEQIEDFIAREPWAAGVEIRCLPTGVDTPTGGRLHLAAAELPAEPFCLTYADGVADIDLEALLAAHTDHDGAATMTVVRPTLPFGVAEVDAEGVVRGFAETPRSEHWVNAGFFCLEPAVLQQLAPDSVLEREALQRLAAQGELCAYRHEGFWDCLDTYKDAVVLNDLWDRGQAPWKLWGAAV
jgi:glucose-1-phosphate cytidylyltransferase